MSVIPYEFSSADPTCLVQPRLRRCTDKRTGRGLKVLKSPPIKATALGLGLPVHQIDTFSGWNLPEYHQTDNPYINLIIAVSFGRLIPSRILNQSKYNGLNIHPSLLPDLPGAAPIQWTIMHGRTTTGVTLQTLHPSKFDQGFILDQTPSPGLMIPNPDAITTKDLTDMLAPVGAEMLVNAIRNQLYLLQHKRFQPPEDEPPAIMAAPKITSQMQAIDFTTQTQAEILRRNRAIGPLYTFAQRDDVSGHSVRINCGKDMRVARAGDVPAEVKRTVASIPCAIPYAIVEKEADLHQSTQPLIVNASDTDPDDRQVILPTITVASMKAATGTAAAARAGLFASPMRLGEYDLYCFSHPLSSTNRVGP
ncbi:Methionyl-tRNA formyltransferase [Exophiala sideris]|uniref:methionyl-tRNA formyltransferase n=1 Tax=Exophiala sideris TaxID=1016849 RepID=A0ABR0JD46_9EURO|nr:Methionyl-tRNA formyltransferase [Exophiala sideris]KAK5040825.1 Methionyl-tRNA formyltransferase [Exophiala sideris]KAK5061840.1 Methionyl-tRNA formyltransferase [Exophiala sideris]KAK5184540.1 Methionyl-tRNA formyltransferase [Eurotiomycetes sp. CCFEE 6388]